MKTFLCVTEYLPLLHIILYNTLGVASVIPNGIFVVPLREFLKYMGCSNGVTELHRQEFNYCAGLSAQKGILEHPIFNSVMHNCYHYNIKKF